MRLHDLFESRMSDFALLCQAVRDLDRAEASFDLPAATVTLRFRLNGEEGWLKLRAKEPGAIRRLLFSAARNQTPHPVMDADQAIEKARSLGSHAIRLLTDPSRMTPMTGGLGASTYGYRGV